MSINKKRYAILYVDDEVQSLKYFSREFSKDFTTLTAESAEEGWNIIEERHDEIGILITDQRMPNMSGVDLLKKICRTYPKIIRLLATAYADLDDAISAVNSGYIYKYISKPWDVMELRITFLRALEFFEVQNERDQLLCEKMSTLQRIILTDRVKNLALFASGLSPHTQNNLEAVHSFFDQLPQSYARYGELDVEEKENRDLALFMQKESHRLFHVISSTHTHLDIQESPGSSGGVNLKEIVENLQKGNSHLTCNITSELPSLSGRPESITKLFEILLSNMKGVGTEMLTFSIAAKKPTDDIETAHVEIVLKDDRPAWNGDQWLDFFAPFTPGFRTEEEYGLHLMSAFFITHHWDGQILVQGKEVEKIIVRLPEKVSVTSKTGLDKTLFEKLFCFTLKW